MMLWKQKGKETENWKKKEKNKKNNKIKWDLSH